MTRLEWFDAETTTAAGYAADERASDGQRVVADIAVELEGPDGVGVLIEGTKSSLLRFATDLIEATLIAEARAQDRKLRQAAMQAPKVDGSMLRHPDGPILQFKLSPEQSAAYKAVEAAGKVAGYYEYTPEADVALTPEQAAAFKAGQAGWDLAGVQRDPDRDSPHPAATGGMIRAYTMDERTAAAVKAGTIGGYSIGDTSLEDLGKEQQ